VCVAAAPSRVMMMQLEDALGLMEQANLPSTIDEHPNWRRKLPLELDALFENARVLALLERLSKSGVSALRTTVTRANKPSRAMFRSIAGSLDADMSERRHFEAGRHFDGRHEGEYLIEIGRF
jgi:hypothetical protein